MGLRSRTLACAATRTRQTQCLQHPSGLYRSHGRVVGDPEVMRRNLSLCIIANPLIEEISTGKSACTKLSQRLASSLGAYPGGEETLVAEARYVPNLDNLCIPFRSELIRCVA
jgi:hypothetical protein